MCLSLFSLLIVACALSSPVGSTELSCQQPDSCPSSVVSCECREALTRLIWTVSNTSNNSLEPLFRTVYGGNEHNAINIVIVVNEYSGVLCDISTTSGDGNLQYSRLTSKLNFTLTDDTHAQYVKCADNGGNTDVFPVQRAISPSTPGNLNSTLISLSSTPVDVAVRLEWDPPLDDGGVAITNYLIFVNTSQQVTSTADTAITLTLNFTGPHLVQISAVNDCGLMGENASKIITVRYGSELDVEKDGIASTNSNMETSTAIENTTRVQGSNLLYIAVGVGGGGAVLVIIFLTMCIIAGTKLLVKTGKLKRSRRKNAQTDQPPEQSAVPRSDRQQVMSEYSLLDVLNGAEPAVAYTEVEIFERATSGQDEMLQLARTNATQYAEVTAYEPAATPATEGYAELSYCTSGRDRVYLNAGASPIPPHIDHQVVQHTVN